MNAIEVQRPQAFRPSLQPKASRPSLTPSQRVFHRWLCLLFGALISEGLARKLAPQALGIPIFFAKDLICLRLLFLCSRSQLSNEAARLCRVNGALTLLLIPCLLATALHDPVLALFGLKQYALFPIVAVSICQAYLPCARPQLYSLLRLLALSVVLTTAVAVAQNRLPAASWLNLSVAGDDLSGFSAGGYLRVSSTFPFVGQYCYYLNAVCFILPACFYLRSLVKRRTSFGGTALFSALFIIGTFVTGSRASVVGNGAVLGLGCALAGCLAGSKAILKMAVVFLLGLTLYWGAQARFPEFFGAYQARVAGTMDQSHAAEVENRLKNNLFIWSRDSIAPSTLFGYGLGVMSNGSEKLSAYARSWRSNGFWTESDQATTLFEGGWYLMLVWYGFRFWVIAQTFRVVLQLRSKETRFAACFALAFILVFGVIGTLAIQPPLAIWWWLAVGVIFCLNGFERFEQLSLHSKSHACRPN